METLVRFGTLILALALLPGCGAPGTSQEGPRSPDPTGYGGQTEGQVTGAVTSVDPEAETTGTYSTMVELLRGRFSGLQISEGPSGDITVRIRGIQSINAQGNPLLVVDGVPVPAYSFSSALRMMDPRDVRRVQVLKDAGSTSTYGTRGAHGVILIRLKIR